MRVEFPADIREDVHIFGTLKLFHLVYLIPAVMLGLLCVFPPFPWGVKLVLIPGVPFAVFCWLLFDVPGILRRRRGFRKEAGLRTAAQDGENIQEIVDVKEAEGVFIVTHDQEQCIYLGVTPGAWDTKPDEEKDQAGVAWMQAVLRVLGHGMKLDCFVINDLEILRGKEDSRERDRASERPLPGSLAALRQARQEYFRVLGETGFSRSCTYVVRISADPFFLDFHPKPKNKQERVTKTRLAMGEIARDVMQKLQASGASAVVLSPELVRDLAARQLNPQLYRNMAPVRGAAWELPEEPEPGKAPARSREKAVLKVAAADGEPELEVARGDARPFFVPPMAPRVPPRDEEAEENSEKGPPRKLKLGLPKPAGPLSLLWLAVRPAAALLNRGKVNLIVITRGCNEISRLSGLTDGLYKRYRMVDTVSFDWVRGMEARDVPADVRKAMRAGFVYVAFSNSGWWPGEDAKDCLALLDKVARKYMCRVEAYMLGPDGSAQQIK